MIFTGRVRTIYVKELVDILRDRRTLIAMVLVPVLLYPLLMLGSVQAISVQESTLREEAAILAAPDQEQAELLKRLIDEDAAALRDRAKQAPAGGSKGPEPLEAEIKYVPQLEEMVRARAIQAGVVFGDHRHFDPRKDQLTLRLIFDPEEARSASTCARLEEVLERWSERVLQNRLAVLRLPLETVRPLSIERIHITTPGSVLSQILPLILVLMTITGAIYPAIDLTAGERERGTLETLMVAPVPVIDLIVGKFLVVTTIAILGAVLNLASVSATVYFGGFQSVLAGSAEASFPFAAFPIILLALIPFAVFFSAVMIAVCSYAHTFKEAQNYITPIILSALVPGGLAALPGSKLSGVMLVTPVANMVLLTKELLLGTMAGRIIGGHVTWTALVWVLGSTTFYAAAAVAAAARIFGTESVVFADTGSIRSAFSRRLFRPSPRPTLSMALIVVALLFPLWFFIQVAIQNAPGAGMETVLRGTALWMPLLFVLAPVAVLLYWKVGVPETLRLRPAGWRFYLAAALIAGAAWAPLHEFFLWQRGFIPVPSGLLEAEGKLNAALRSLPVFWAFLCVALVPGACEELFFRGFLLSGLRSSWKAPAALLASAAAFGMFHFFIFKAPLTILLGLLLGYLCARSGSILPGILAHAGHNGLALARVRWDGVDRWLGISSEEAFAHLPTGVVVTSAVMLVAAVVLCARTRRSE